MLECVHIRNFKCFESLSLPLRPLTLLTGFNSAGKSTALQAILLLAQALRKGGRTRKIPLNGPLLKLGSPGEVWHDGAPPELTIEVGIETINSKVEWQLVPKERLYGNALGIQGIQFRIGQNSSETVEIDHNIELDNLLPLSIPEDIREICRGLARTVFLSALRDKAEDAYPIPEMDLVCADVGAQGEYAAWWFEQHMEDDVEPARRHPTETAYSLRRQYNAWAGELFPGAQANAQRVPHTSLVRLEWRNHETDEWRRPANIGYGLSYAFPILVAGLIAKPGQIFVVDSPEAHLHPRGQSRMGAFLGMLAAAGLQVIVETHSDHILNGVRLAVSHGDLSPEDAAIHFFNPRPRSENDPAHVVSPRLDRNGNLSEWPKGFFDQAENDLAILAGWT